MKLPEFAIPIYLLGCLSGVLCLGTMFIIVLLNQPIDFISPPPDPQYGSLIEDILN